MKKVVLDVDKDEVVIAIKKSPLYKDMNDVALIEHCLKGVENNGWCYRIVNYSEMYKDFEPLREGSCKKGGVNSKPTTPRPPGIPRGQNPVIPGRVNDCVCRESWDC